MRHIRENGPTPCRISFSSDIDNERNTQCPFKETHGIYMHSAGFPSYYSDVTDIETQCCNSMCEPVGHAMSLVGWGTTTKINGSRIYYWIVRNSWGLDFGGTGIFRAAFCGEYELPGYGRRHVNLSLGIEFRVPCAQSGQCGGVVDIGGPHEADVEFFMQHSK